MWSFSSRKSGHDVGIAHESGSTAFEKHYKFVFTRGKNPWTQPTKHVSHFSAQDMFFPFNTNAEKNHSCNV